jgi:hypothetical protein
MMCLLGSACFGVPVVIDHRHTDITQLTGAQITRAKAVLHVAYGHTSHGSQLTDGMSGLVGFANGGGKGLALPLNAFAWNNGGVDGALDLHDYAMGGDVGYYPDWVNNTQNYLNAPANSNVNVIIWSWCGQMTGKFTAGILANEYLAPMSMLETSYPDVVFVYMTGHVDIWSDADQKAACKAIRDYCIDNNKVLYDFADIEHYDPDGVYYEFVDDNCGVYTGPGTGLHGNWATNWQGTHTAGVDWYSCGSAHSQPLNANQKAYAAWALWCTIAADLDREGIPDEWEERYGGAHLFGPGTNNFDGDAMTDWEEYVADTVPTSPASRFEILGVSATNSCTLTFSSSVSRVYSLVSSDDLRGDLWSVVGILTNQPGTGGIMSLTDTNPAQVRLYRLNVSLP